MTSIQTPEPVFISPSYGRMKIEDIREKTIEFMECKPEDKYRLVIGTDSQPKNGKGADFVTAIIVHRVGYGGIYFWKRTVNENKLVLRTRIHQEALMSLECAQEFLDVMKNDGITKYDVEIHVDIGSFGETKDLINEVVGIIRSYGFDVKTKPYSYGASKVADRHT